jgi:hypothetical protein
MGRKKLKDPMPISSGLQFDMNTVLGMIFITVLTWHFLKMVIRKAFGTDDGDEDEGVYKGDSIFRSAFDSDEDDRVGAYKTKQFKLELDLEEEALYGPKKSSLTYFDIQTNLKAVAST